MQEAASVGEKLLTFNNRVLLPAIEHFSLPFSRDGCMGTLLIFFVHFIIK